MAERPKRPKAVAKAGLRFEPHPDWPLTIITGDELDWLGAAVSVSNARLDALLKRFHRLYPSRMISLGEFLSSNTADFFDSDKVRENVNDRFRTKTEGTLERFKNGDYGGA